MSTPAMISDHVQIGEQSIAVRRAGRAGPFVVFVHGNSCSSRCFQRQLDSDLSERFQLVAIDLPGHGDSAKAPPSATRYTLPSYAEVVVAVARQLGASSGVFVGWSLGGHVLLEASDELTEAAGLLVFGAPPIASSADFPRALSANPAVHAAFRESSTEEEIRALLSLFFKAGYPLPPLFLEDFRRADPQARALLGASVGANALDDEVRAVAAWGRPLAVLHGAHDAIANLAYLVDVPMPTLWRGALQLIPGVGHAPQWEDPAAFNRLLHDFTSDCTRPA